MFVDDEVVAEPKGAPRHPYGLYCAVRVGMSEAAIAERVQQWIGSGEAYEEFLAMNVCRYNC